jgi:chloramphenicol-sensitive protein RarD
VNRHGEAGRGVAYGLAAYGFWGFVPLYFKAVAHVTALEVLAHRIVWSAVLLLSWLGLRGRLGELRRALRRRRTLAGLGATTVLIAVNWLTFIWAVAQARVIECSLGYFITPLVNVLLGFLFLGERLRRLQLVSVGLAALGVGYLTASYGRVPGVALVLASSFGSYGLLRKRMDVDSVLRRCCFCPWRRAGSRTWRAPAPSPSPAWTAGPTSCSWRRAW